MQYFNCNTSIDRCTKVYMVIKYVKIPAIKVLKPVRSFDVEIIYTISNAASRSVCVSVCSLLT